MKNPKEVNYRPKVKKFTPKQEEDLEKSEKMLARSDMLISGVQVALGIGYEGFRDLDVAIDVLREASMLRKNAFALKRLIDL